MSATRDKDQKATFVYSNLYQIYRKGKAAAKSAGLTTSQVLKASDLKAPFAVYQPKHVTGHVVTPARVKKPAVIRNPAVDSLRENLKSLNDLHSRLRFMLQELEELVKD